MYSEANTSESYYLDMRKVAEKQHIPILTGLNSLTTDREWVVQVVFGMGQKIHWVLIATCEQLVWSNRIGRNMPN